MTGVKDHPLLCANCHLYMIKSGLISKLVNREYRSPFNLAISGDGRRLYVVSQEGNALLVIDPEQRKVLNRISVGDQPHSVILSRDGVKAYVSNQWSDNISVIDLSTSKIIDTLKTANGPAGLALSLDGKVLYAVNSYSSNVSVIDLNTKEERKRLDAGNNPTGVSLSPDGKFIYITSRRNLFSSYGDPVRTEITVLDDSTQRISERKIVESAHMIENVAFTPSGDLALVPLVRPKNFVPSIQVERGFIMNYGIGIIEQKKDGRIIQLLLDEPNALLSGSLWYCYFT